MTEKLHAVHDNDFESLLDNLGLSRKLSSGKSKCKFCRETVTNDNLLALLPEDKEIKFVCDNCSDEMAIWQYNRGR